MYHHIANTIDPLLASISTVLIVLTLVLMIVLDRFYGLDRVCRASHDRRRGVDTLVIGGGLVGLSVAYGLARAGERVQLLDEGDDAYRAARGNFGLVWVQGKGLGRPDYARWTLQAAAAWPAFAPELVAAHGDRSRTLAAGRHDDVPGRRRVARAWRPARARARRTPGGLSLRGARRGCGAAPDPRRPARRWLAP
jgi:glycine/D-amino acid oxidase-like deaminating enzyme